VADETENPADKIKCQKCGHLIPMDAGWKNASANIGCPACGELIRLKVEKLKSVLISHLQETLDLSLLRR
jgi:DNA-directed RNA polymerase subunit RPC12/RpoP